MSEGARSGGNQEGVGVAVIAAAELHDLVATGSAAGQADGAHGGFGAGVHQAQHLAPGHAGADLFT